MHTFQVFGHLPRRTRIVIRGHLEVFTVHHPILITGPAQQRVCRPVTLQLRPADRRRQSRSPRAYSRIRRASAWSGSSRSNSCSNRKAAPSLPDSACARANSNNRSACCRRACRELRVPQSNELRSIPGRPRGIFRRRQEQVVTVWIAWHHPRPGRRRFLCQTKLITFRSQCR